MMRIFPLHPNTTISLIAVAFFLAVAVAFAVRGSHRAPPTPEPGWEVRGGDAERGRAAVAAYGCGACHVIPGVRGANARVGPRLTGLIDQSYIAGVLANEPENLVRWIQNPRNINPQTAMPDLGVPEDEARDIAAYLYSQRD